MSSNSTTPPASAGRSPYPVLTGLNIRHVTEDGAIRNATVLRAALVNGVDVVDLEGATGVPYDASRTPGTWHLNASLRAAARSLPGRRAAAAAENLPSETGAGDGTGSEGSTPPGSDAGSTAETDGGPGTTGPTAAVTEAPFDDAGSGAAAAGAPPRKGRNRKP